MSEKPTPRSNLAAPPVSPVTGEPPWDVAMILGRIADELQANNREIKAVGLVAETTRKSVQELRKEQAQHLGQTAALQTRVENVESRATSSERKLRRHDSGFQRASETDAKLQSDQAAQIIAIEETRRNSKAANDNSKEAIEIATRALQEIEAVKKETKGQTPVLTRIENEQKNKPAAPMLASVLSLAVALVYLVLEIIAKQHH